MTVAVSVETELQRAVAHKLRFVLMIAPPQRGGFLPRPVSGAMAQSFGRRAGAAILALVHLLVIVPGFDRHFC